MAIATRAVRPVRKPLGAKMSTKPWPEERAALVAQMYRNGLSAGVIATKMRARGIDLTRNAIIGKLHRMGLRDGERSHRRLVTRLAMPPRTPKAKAPREVIRFARVKAQKIEFPSDTRPIRDDPPTDALVKHILDLEEHHCRYIPGEPTDGWCGRPKEPGLPYCIAHAQLCFQAPRVERQEPVKQKHYEVVA